MNNSLIPAPHPDYQLAGSMDAPSGPASSFRVQRFLIFLRKYWWIPILTMLTGFVLGLGYVYWKLPTFISRASMWETLKVRLPEGALFDEDEQNFLGTQTALLQSETLRQQALARMRASTNSAMIVMDKDNQPLPVAINVMGTGKSSVFVVEATSSNPMYTQAYLDALMGAYLEYKKNVRKVVSEDTLASISEEVQHWERDLKGEQDVLVAFERTNNLTILEEQAKVAGDYLGKLETQLSDYQLEYRLLDARAIELDAAHPKPGTSSKDLHASGTDNSGSLVNAAAEDQADAKDIDLLKFERERLGRYLRPKHPKMVKLDADIKLAEKMQDIFSKQNREQLIASRQATQLKIDNVKAAIKEWEPKVVGANNLIAEADRLKQNIQRVASVYDRLVMMVQNVGISRNIDLDTVAILENAAPAKRSYFSEKSGLMKAVMTGLFAGLGIVFLISVRDDRFTSITDVNSSFGDSVVGLLPQVGQNGESQLPLLELNDSRHIYAESYRSLRSALLFLTMEGERPKILLITSAVPNEGKSTVAANLAYTLALSGSNVLLVDGDLRKGHLHRMLNMRNEPGFAELLKQTCDPDTVMQNGSLPNMKFISGGKHSGNPGDLFLSSALNEVLNKWRRDFDYVVIDSSPLFAADDVSCLAPKVDGTLFVVRSHHSSARATREALDLLHHRRAKVLGVIFNGANTSGRSYRYYKYEDYHFPITPA